MSGVVRRCKELEAEVERLRLMVKSIDDMFLRAAERDLRELEG